ncbi:MAG TPA: ABC transporter permease subunit [Micromonosporaceae bacterium]|nr:ABC transporter permease subunit [Micromonosporaceae bacterium]
MRLVRAEWSRFFARRFTRIMVVVVLGILGLILIGVGASSHQPNPAVIAQAEAQAAEVRTQVTAMRAQCEEEQRNPGAVDPNQKQFGQLPPGVTCAQIFDPAQVRPEDFMPHVFSFADEAPDLLKAFGGVLTLFAFAVGASFIGAEWSSGGVMNQLLWRPRRLRLVTGKLGTLLVAIATTTIALMGVWIAALWGLATLRGRMGEVTSGVSQSMGLTGLRALALVLAAGAIGFAVASLGRNTATAMGLAVGYVIVLEIGTRIVLEVAEVIKPEKWFLSTYAMAWLNQRVIFTEWRHCRYDTTGNCQSYDWAIDMKQASIVFGSILLVSVFAAFLAFRQRDVT